MLAKVCSGECFEEVARWGGTLPGAQNTAHWSEARCAATCALYPGCEVWEYHPVRGVKIQFAHIFSKCLLKKRLVISPALKEAVTVSDERDTGIVTGTISCDMRWLPFPDGLTLEHKDSPTRLPSLCRPGGFCHVCMPQMECGAGGACMDFCGECIDNGCGPFPAASPRDDLFRRRSNWHLASTARCLLGLVKPQRATPRPTLAREATRAPAIAEATSRSSECLLLFGSQCGRQPDGHVCIMLTGAVWCVERVASCLMTLSMNTSHTGCQSCLSCLPCSSCMGCSLCEWCVGLEPPTPDFTEECLGDRLTYGDQSTGACETSDVVAVFAPPAVLAMGMRNSWWSQVTPAMSSVSVRPV